MPSSGAVDKFSTPRAGKSSKIPPGIFLSNQKTGKTLVSSNQPELCFFFKNFNSHFYIYSLGRALVEIISFDDLIKL